MPILNIFFAIIWIVLLGQSTKEFDDWNLKFSHVIYGDTVIVNAVALPSLLFHVIIVIFMSFPSLVNVEFRHGWQGFLFVSFMRYSALAVFPKPYRFFATDLYFI